MTFDEWVKEEEVLEIYDAVEVAKDAWNEAMLQAMEAINKQPTMIRETVINKRQALLAIAEMRAL